MTIMSRRTVLAAVINPDIQKLLMYVANELKTYPVLDYDYTDNVLKNFVTKGKTIDIKTGVSACPIVTISITEKYDSGNAQDWDINMKSSKRVRNNIPISMLPDYMHEDLFGVNCSYWSNLRHKFYDDIKVLKNKFSKGGYGSEGDGEQQLENCINVVDDNMGSYIPRWLHNTIYYDFRFWSDMDCHIDGGDSTEQVKEWYRNWARKNKV